RMAAAEALTAARLLLPLGTALAEGTLRTLAAHQGLRHDPATGEEPGRMPEELPAHRPVDRPPELEPTSYHGAIAPTPLWIVLLHDAWRAGLPLEAVRELRTGLHAALGWLHERVGEGFLLDEARSALDDQGSSHPGGAPTDAPVASARLQALACRAGLGAAALLDA
ncbi:amylo-alpha-1,6-glucosidase, partial [Agrococcus sp. HG114]|nr:amylo-alpha-1,6-glucosidase [Agrococcus sp. HG114]